jgi:hypothetical protein
MIKCKYPFLGTAADASPSRANSSKSEIAAARSPADGDRGPSSSQESLSKLAVLLPSRDLSVHAR